MKIHKALANGIAESLSNDFNDVPELLYELEVLKDATATRIEKTINRFASGSKKFTLFKCSGDLFLFTEVDGMGNVGYLTVDYRGK